VREQDGAVLVDGHVDVGFGRLWSVNRDLVALSKRDGGVLVDGHVDVGFGTRSVGSGASTGVLVALSKVGAAFWIKSYPC
jgi:hypothetical protein